jgi:uncharacterized membrane protein
MSRPYDTSSAESSCTLYTPPRGAWCLWPGSKIAWRAPSPTLGSICFVHLHLIWSGVWVAANPGLLLAMGVGVSPWDPFPFGLLTLVVSLEAIFLSTFVMIAQNRLSALADLRAEADYQVNLRAEAEVAKILALVQSLVEHQVSEAEHSS